MEKKSEKSLEKLFGGLNMSWWHTLLFAVVTGVYTGLIMLIPALAETSFQDIGVSYEWWVLFAVIVVVNCGKPLEAAIKCFVFFLVSQPLVYAVEVLLGNLSFELAKMYYTKIWLRMTYLTLPGGLIAFFCKKQNILGAVILGIGNAIICVMGVHYAISVFENFPYHLLTVIFCICAVVVMSFGVQRKTLNRAVSLIVPILLTAAFVAYTVVQGLSL